MKNVTVKYVQLLDQPTADGVLIETLEDIKLLEQEYNRAEERVIKKFVTSGEPSRRYDHVISGLRPTEQPLAILAVAYGTMHEKNPIYMLPSAKAAALKTATSTLLRQGAVFMNEKGSFTPIMSENRETGEPENYLEIIEERDFDNFEHKVRHRIQDGTKYLNLENDWELERAAIKWLEQKDRKFSYITELSTLHLEYELPRMFEQFVEKGGTHIYVYTTGQNYAQMYDYSKVAIRAGIKDFVFDFNAGMDMNINEFVDWLKQRANVEILNKQ